MPSLSELHNRNQNEDYIILAISVREKKKTVKQYIKKNKIPLSVLLDPDGAIANAYGIRGYPTHYLIDRQGNLVGAALGPKDWESKEAGNLIRHLVDRKR